MNMYVLGAGHHLMLLHCMPAGAANTENPLGIASGLCTHARGVIVYSLDRDYASAACNTSAVCFTCSQGTRNKERILAWSS